MTNSSNELTSLQQSNAEKKAFGRRTFLKSAGLTSASAAALFAMSCTDHNNPTDPTPVNLGSGDFGILNYAYALEQLEAAFYTEVIKNPYSGITNKEFELLDDIRRHEVSHREFFKAALGANAIRGLEVDFSKIDFKSRASVLGTAKVFENLGVAAYNGAGKYITAANVQYLLLAGKIVSVEARHAAIIGDLINPNNLDFAGMPEVDAQGLDKALYFTDVLTAAQPFIKTVISGSQLPAKK